MPYGALNPPPMVHDKDDAHEVLRAAVHNGEMHFSLRRGFTDAGAWGILLADAARHIARVYAHENVLTEDAALERIRQGFDAAINEPPDSRTQTTEIKETQ
jgi:Domain of unknown function (DUF5076)